MRVTMYPLSQIRTTSPLQKRSTLVADGLTTEVREFQMLRLTPALVHNERAPCGQSNTT